MAPVPGIAAATIYVEPGLGSDGAERLAVIVTASNSTVAAAAVNGVGGRVTSDLWLIDGVAATIPPAG